MFRNMTREFQEFILKGNAFDLAVGVIIGAAFGAVVSSLVSDIIMPPIGLITGGIDFSSHFIDMTALLRGESAMPSLKAAQDAGHAVIAYGKFINTVINLLIVGAAIFIVVKQINRFRRIEEKPDQIKLLTEIRDILARK